MRDYTKPTQGMTNIDANNELLNKCAKKTKQLSNVNSLIQKRNLPLQKEVDNCIVRKLQVQTFIFT